LIGHKAKNTLQVSVRFFTMILFSMLQNYNTKSLKILKG